MQTAPRGESVGRFGFVAQAIEACVCGGFVVADRANEQSVEAAVRMHQRSLLHRIWRAKERL